MDVTGFLGGSWLTQLDLPATAVVWTIREITQQLVGGADTKICIRFDQHQKLLGLNKTNLKAVAGAYGVDSNAWIGRPLELYRDTTFFQGAQKPCIRVRIPQQQQYVQPVQQQPVQYSPQPAAPVAAPQQPVAAPAPQPVQPPAQQPVQPQQQPPATDQAFWGGTP